MRLPKLQAKTIAILMFTLSFPLGLPPLAAAVEVVGQNDAAVDRQAIQDAIDGAAPGDAIVLRGTFQLDGERIFITKAPLKLEGVALDNDGDGAVNEDWGDGADNDGDGAVDEDDWDAVLVGVAQANGQPAADPDNATFFNRGLVVSGISEAFSGLVIENLKFSTHHRAVTLTPDSDSTGGVLCGNQFQTPGSIAGMKIEKCWFDNNNRAVQAFGAVADLVVEANLFTASRNNDLLIVGQLLGCAGEGQPLPIGTPRRTTISENRVLGGNVGVLSLLSESTAVEENTFRGSRIPILTSEDTDISITENSIANSTFGIVTDLATVGGRVAENHLVASGVFGILLQNGSAGYTVEENVFQGSGFVDVFLDDTTFDNLIIVRPGDTVIDEGTGNQIVVED